ncbi:S24 family peptidase [Jeotgalibaca porci]
MFDYDNQQVILRSLNSEYEDRVLKDEEYKIVGKVVK